MYVTNYRNKQYTAYVDDVNNNNVTIDGVCYPVAHRHEKYIYITYPAIANIDRATYPMLIINDVNSIEIIYLNGESTIHKMFSCEPERLLPTQFILRPMMVRKSNIKMIIFECPLDLIEADNSFIIVQDNEKKIRFIENIYKENDSITLCTRHEGYCFMIGQNNNIVRIEVNHTEDEIYYEDIYIVQ